MRSIIMANQTNEKTINTSFPLVSIINKLKSECNAVLSINPMTRRRDFRNFPLKKTSPAKNPRQADEATWTSVAPKNLIFPSTSPPIRLSESNGLLIKRAFSTAAKPSAAVIM